jgi:acyl carrier protein
VDVPNQVEGEGGSDVASEFAALVVEITDLPADQVRHDAALRADLQVDSLSLVEIVVATEEQFGVRIPDEDAKRLLTVGDYVDYLTRARSS